MKALLPDENADGKIVLQGEAEEEGQARLHRHEGRLPAPYVTLRVTSSALSNARRGVTASLHAISCKRIGSSGQFESGRPHRAQQLRIPSGQRRSYLIHGMWMTPLSWSTRSAASPTLATRCSRRRRRAERVPAAAPGSPRRFGTSASPTSLTTTTRSSGSRAAADHHRPLLRRAAAATWPTEAWALPPSRWERAPKGVLRSLSTLRPRGLHWRPGESEEGSPTDARAVPLVLTNSLSRKESDAVYEQYYVPAPLVPSSRPVLPTSTRRR